MQARALEKSICGDLKSKDDSDSDEGDSFTVEWEAVSTIICLKLSYLKFDQTSLGTTYPMSRSTSGASKCAI